MSFTNISENSLFCVTHLLITLARIPTISIFDMQNLMDPNSVDKTFFCNKFKHTSVTIVF